MDNPHKARPVLHVFHVGFISASTLDVEGGLTTLVVRQSKAVDDDDWVRAPVGQFLRAWCHTLLGIFERRDRSMMFGTAVTSTYVIHETCPGTDAHECAQDKKGMAA